MKLLNFRWKSLWAVATILGLLVLFVFSFRHLWARSPIHYENFNQIVQGMTKAEVVRLLGCSPGNHSTGQVHIVDRFPDGMNAYFPVVLPDYEVTTDGEQGKTYIWLGDHGVIAVTFGLPDDRVCRKGYVEGRRLPCTWWPRIEHLLGRNVPRFVVEK